MPQSELLGTKTTSQGAKFSNQNLENRKWRIWAWLVSWLVCLLSLGLTPTGLILEGLNSPYLDLLKIRTYPVQALIAVSFPLIGALIVTFKPTQLVGYLLSATGFLMALATVSRQYAVYSLITNPGSLPGGALVGWCYLWSWMLADILLPLIFLLFPTGRLLSFRWRWLLWLNLAGGILIIIPVGIISWGARGVRLVSIKPNELMGPAIALTGLGVVLVVIVAVGAVFSILVRFRRSKGEERLQLKWFTYAVALTTLAEAISFIADATENQILIDITNAATYVTITAIPASLAIAILKYRLFDIDLVINRTLVYGMLTFGLIGVYLLIISLVELILNGQGNLAGALFATGLIAILFQPLYQRVQRGVNRLMYGERDEPYRALTRLGQRLEETLAVEAILPTIVESVAQALKLPYAALVLRGAGDKEQEETIAASFGKPPGEQTFKLGLNYQQETLGKLVLAPRTPGEEFSPADQRLLADLTHQIAIAVHAVRLTLDLRASALALQQTRERLVTAREEERRRLRRNLHDGLGPALATLSLKAEAARDLIYLQPAESCKLLNELIQEAQTAITDIRRLVYDLRPPALDDLGLVGAIQSQLASLEVSGLRLKLNAPDKLPSLPAAVEVAAYRIIQEALTNVVRHAAAEHCCVTLALYDTLQIEIKDDGRGLPDSYRSGVGFLSMSERAAELGGSCQIETLPEPEKGTRIQVILPLPLPLMLSPT